MGLPAGIGLGIVAMDREELGLPGDVIVVFAQVPVDAAQVAVVDAAADHHFPRLIRHSTLMDMDPVELRLILTKLGC